MVTNERLPRVRDDALLPAATYERSSKKLGMTAVVDAAGKLVGVFSDGDLRRALDTHDFKTTCVADVMTRAPKTITPEKLAAEAAEIIQRHKIGSSGLLVVDAKGNLVGAVSVLDLMNMGVV